jgi:hypothetical protein
MNEQTQVLVEAILAALGLVLVLLVPRVRAEPWRRWLRGGLLALGIVAAAAYPNFGRLHPDGTFVHNWDQFHYFLGAKYFAEVGYDGLYVASMGAEMSDNPSLGFQPFLRDLRTNEVVPTGTLAEHGLEVRRRFSAERWQAFRRDNRHFTSLDSRWFMQIRLDHGFNPSPAWTALAQPFASRVRVATARGLGWLGMLDLALLALAFFVVFRTYGRDVGLLFLVVFGSGFAWRFFWLGGAFLRQDWLVATILAACMLHRRRFFLAGLLLAWAAMVRIFPIVFLAGPTILFLRDWMEGRDRRWFVRLAGGFALGAALLFLAGSATGRGAHAWVEFAGNLKKHSGTWLTNNVGLANLVLYDGVTYRRQLVDWSQPEPWTAWQARMDLLKRERRPWLLLATAAFLGLAGVAAWRARDPDVALAVGVACAFALVLLTNYYWGMLVLLLVRRPWETAAALLAFDLVLCALSRSPAFEVIYGGMSWALAALLAWWLGWLAWRGPSGPRETSEQLAQPRVARA